MNTIFKSKSLAWVLGGCSLLVIFACIFTLVFGASGALLAIRRASLPQAENNVSHTTNTTPTTATLQNLQGSVEVKTENGDWAAAVPDQLVSNTQHLRTGKLSSVSVVFHDGSQALLKASSEIVFDEINAPENGGERSIVMTQIIGESFHQVTPNKNNGSRYEVNTSSGSGAAKGTEFQVVVTPEQKVYYYVLEGVVAVSAVEITVLVNPGFMTILYPNQPPLDPIQSITVEGLVSQNGDPWTVAGTSFISTSDTVVVGSPQVGDWVLIKGHLDENDENVADWVILLRSAVTNQFSLTGTVETMDASQWTVNGQVITLSETAQIDENIQLGDKVYVKGFLDGEGMLQATKIERLSEEDGQPFSFSGVLQKIDGSVWYISGVEITTDENTELPDQVKAGDLVMVQGYIQDDSAWLANKISLASDEDSAFSIIGILESQTPWTVSGVSFETQEDTDIQEGLITGDRVRVEGFIDADGVWIATRIERIDEDAEFRMTIVGTVISIDPWIVNGLILNLAPNAVVDGQVTVGMLVRVELALQPDGTWLVVKIEPIDHLIWIPGCLDVIATVVSVDGNQLQLLNWPLMTLAEDAVVEGTLAPNSVVRMKICFDSAMVIKVTFITIIEIDPIEQPAGEEGGKVTVCHKPDGKKGGHSITISQSALPAHLAHGDYVGSCR